MVAGVSLAVNLAQTILLQALSVKPYRAIGSIIPDCTLEEQHSDAVTATNHPVELGAAITDHAYSEAPELIIHAGWSDSGNYDGYINDVYAELLALKAARQLINVYTGKRSYQNMIVLGVATMTDAANAHSMMVVCRLRQLFIVQTYATTLPPAANQANPSSTAAPVGSGTQQTTPTTPQNSSILNNMFGG
jgi:hypothetical protein